MSNKKFEYLFKLVITVKLLIHFGSTKLHAVRISIYIPSPVYDVLFILHPSEKIVVYGSVV